MQAKRDNSLGGVGHSPIISSGGEDSLILIKIQQDARQDSQSNSRNNGMTLSPGQSRADGCYTLTLHPQFCVSRVRDHH